MTVRRRMPAPARREQLLDACAVIVDTEGFHAVTIDRVATACDVTRTVVYQHFGSLDGMLDAVIGRASERAAATFAAATTQAGKATMRSAMKRVFEAVDADPVTWRMFLVAPNAAPPMLDEWLARGRAMIREYNIAAARGAEPLADAELTARLLQVVADELVRLRLADPSEYTVERLLDQFDTVARAIVRGGRVRK